MKDKCDKNCATCTTDNRSFCAVQLALANQELLLSLINNRDNAVLLCPEYIQKSEPTDSGADTQIPTVGA